MAAPRLFDFVCLFDLFVLFALSAARQVELTLTKKYSNVAAMEAADVSALLVFDIGDTSIDLTTLKDLEIDVGITAIEPEDGMKEDRAIQLVTESGRQCPLPPSLARSLPAPPPIPGSRVSRHQIRSSSV